MWSHSDDMIFDHGMWGDTGESPIHQVLRCFHAKLHGCLSSPPHAPAEVEHASVFGTAQTTLNEATPERGSSYTDETTVPEAAL